MNKLKNDSIYELVTKTGTAYIGRLIEVIETNSLEYLFTDVLTVAMRPMHVKEIDQIQMIPAMELVGIFVNDPVFYIPESDIYMIAEVTTDEFISMYKTNVKMYNDAKIMTRSNIEITDQMPDAVAHRKR